jgi:hypothetical protein
MGKCTVTGSSRVVRLLPGVCLQQKRHVKGCTDRAKAPTRTQVSQNTHQALLKKAPNCLTFISLFRCKRGQIRPNTLA